MFQAHPTKMLQYYKKRILRWRRGEGKVGGGTICYYKKSCAQIGLKCLIATQNIPEDFLCYAISNYIQVNR